MLVFDIVKKIKENEIRKQAAAVQKANVENFRQSGKGLGLLEVSTVTSQKDTGYVSIRFSGQIFSVASVLMTRFTNMLVGFAIGSMSYSDEEREDLGAQSSLLKTSMITIGSSVISLTLGDLVYDTYYGTEIGDIRFNVPVRKKGESFDDFKKRVEIWKSEYDKIREVEDDLPPVLKEVVDNFYKKISDALNVNLAMSVIEGGITAYHGYKRSGSIWTAIGWAVFGNVGVAMSQGYAKKENK